MAQVKVIILDDDGQELSTHIYGLGDGLVQLNTNRMEHRNASSNDFVRHHERFADSRSIRRL